MALAKGINAYIGYGGEGATPGTKGTIDLFSRLVSGSMKAMKDPFFSESLTPHWDGDMFYSAERAEGPLVFEVAYTGLELFWHSLFGTYTFSTATPVAGTHTHAFTFAPTTNAHPALSIEQVTGIGGSLEEAFLGCYPQKATIEFRPRQVPKVTFDMVGMGHSVGAATSPTIPADKYVLPAHKTTLTLGGAALTILSGSLEFEVPRQADREHYGETVYKEAVVRGRPKAQFSLECEWSDASGADVAAFRTNYHAGAEITGLVLTHQGDIITGATKYQWGIAATNAFIKAAFPSIQGEETVKCTVEGQVTGGLALTMINATAAQVT